jgi:hypothetical protein
MVRWRLAGKGLARSTRSAEQVIYAALYTDVGARFGVRSRRSYGRSIKCPCRCYSRRFCLFQIRIDVVVSVVSAFLIDALWGKPYLVYNRFVKSWRGYSCVSRGYSLRKRGENRLPGMNRLFAFSHPPLSLISTMTCSRISDTNLSSLWVYFCQKAQATRSAYCRAGS